jgi:hypothetical protein
MFDKIQVSGQTNLEETIKERVKDPEGNILSESTVKETSGDFSKVTIDCQNESVTLKGRIEQIQRTMKVATVVAFRVEEPGKAAYEVTSLDSPRLYDKDGDDLEVPADTVVTPVQGGKGF